MSLAHLIMTEISGGYHTLIPTGRAVISTLTGISRYYTDLNFRSSFNGRTPAAWRRVGELSLRGLEEVSIGLDIIGFRSSSLGYMSPLGRGRHMVMLFSFWVLPHPAHSLVDSSAVLVALWRRYIPTKSFGPYSYYIENAFSSTLRPPSVFRLCS